MAALKISYILGSYPQLPIGGYRIVYEHANGLAARGHQVSLLHCRESIGHPNPPKGAALVRTYLAYCLRRWMRAKPTWFKFHPAVRIDLVPDDSASNIPDGDYVIATAWYQGSQLLSYPAKKGRKTYLFQHYEDWSGPKDKVDATWRAPFLKIAISSWLRQVGVEMGVADIHLIPNAIDHELFRSHDGGSARGRVVGMMCSDQPWKGTSDGLRALEIARQQITDLHAILFGVRRPLDGLPDWVTFIENPTQVRLAEIYNQCAVFVCPSHSEGFALPPVEAMACGAALVSTACGGNSDYAVHDETALLSAPRDSGSLARSIVQLLEDEILLRRIAEAGRIKARSLRWEASIDALEALFQEQLQAAT